MIPLSANETIYKLIKKDPKIKEVLHKVGFEDIVKPGMVSTVGRFMTIKKGCDMRHIDIMDIKQKLVQYNYKLVDIE